MTTFPKRTTGASTAENGLKYLLYVNTGTDEKSPTWTVIGGLRSNDLSRQAEEIDASHKTSGGWKTTIPGLRSWSVELEAVILKGDKGAQFLEEAFNAGEQVHVKFEYPDKSYRTGWGALTECSISVPHDDVATISGTINGDGPLSDVQQGG